MSLLPKKPVMDQEFVKTAAHVNYATVGRKLTESVREYKTAAVVTPLLVLGEVVFEVMIPLYTADLIDAIKSGANLSQILSTGGVLALMALVSLAFGAAAGLTCAKASTGFAKNLRKDMFYNIQTFSFAVIDRFSSSSLVTRITTDVMNVQMAYMMLIRTAIRSPFMLVLAFIAAYSMAGWLALVFVVIIPVLAVALFAVIRKVVPVFRRIFRKYDALNERAEENLAGIRVVKSYVREDYEKEKYDRAATEVQNDFTYAETHPRPQRADHELLHLHGHGLRDLRRLLRHRLHARRAARRGAVLLAHHLRLHDAHAAHDALDDLRPGRHERGERAPHLRGPRREDHDRPARRPRDRGRRRLNRLRRRRVLLSRGQGPRGAPRHRPSHQERRGHRRHRVDGLRQVDPRPAHPAPLRRHARGPSAWAARDVRDYDLETLRDAVAMVLQKNVLFSGTIAENLRWGNEHATDEEVLEAGAPRPGGRASSRAFPDKYDTYIEQGGTNVSGGQKQRLCIARALLQAPQDPDPRRLDLAPSTPRPTRLIREGFRNYLPDDHQGHHRPAHASSVEDADRIVVMDSGTHQRHRDPRGAPAPRRHLPRGLRSRRTSRATTSASSASWR